jgi:hypothetical protein
MTSGSVKPFYLATAQDMKKKAKIPRQANNIGPFKMHDREIHHIQLYLVLF